MLFRSNSIFRLQIEKATLQQDTIEKPHQQYLQVLRDWYKERQLTAQPNRPPITSTINQFLPFPDYKKITKALSRQHLHWQIDTIEILLNRNETIEYTLTMIHVQRPTIRQTRSGQKQPRWNCLQAKKQAQLRRYELSKNERKDNQMGEYACREPFQLLKDTLILPQVFELYEKKIHSFSL